MLLLRSLSIAAAAAGMLVASQAGAVSFSLHLVDSGKAYSVKYNLSGGTHTVLAAEFDGVLGGQAGSAYCIDLHQIYHEGLGTGYSILDLGSLLNGYAAAWLLETYRPDRSAADAKTKITALQIAIWEVTNDTSWDLAHGFFRVLSTKSAALSLAQTYLASIPAHLTSGGSVIALTHPIYQDELFIPNHPVVPEPATALLVGAGVAALGRRRRA